MYYIFVELENEYIKSVANNITCAGKILFFIIKY